MRWVRKQKYKYDVYDVRMSSDLEMLINADAVICGVGIGNGPLQVQQANMKDHDLKIHQANVTTFLSL